MKRNKILASMNRYGQNKDHANMDEYRDEILKDRWDVRKLGIPFNTTRADYFISFENIDAAFRGLIKKYVQQRVFVQDSITFATARSEVINMGPFIKIIVLKHPNWTDFSGLSRIDIEEYFEHLRSRSTSIRGRRKGELNRKAPSDYYIWRMIGSVENFLYYIQRYEWPEAPNLPVRKLIYQEDRPKLLPKKDEDYAYVSDFVWEQIVQHIDQVDEQYLPILLLVEATGFRLYDILNFKYDCLLNINGDYWIQSERINSRYQFPMVPIKRELAELIIEHRNKVQLAFPDEKNPKKLLFIRYKRGLGNKKGVGSQILQNALLRYLDRFAESANIIDESGKTFHFTMNAFKHRFGLKITTSGLSMAQIHQLIANVTSEMSMIYARKIQKETLNKES